MAEYIRYIRTIYRSSEVERNPRVTKWPPTPSKIFINLVCIDRKTVVTKQEADEITKCMVCDGSVDVILKKKRPIKFSDITRDLPDTALEKVILVEGAPGVGKSTFAWEFCRRWERGEIAKQYELVLLLRLRDKHTWKAQSLADLICHPSDNTGPAVVQELKSTLGINTLIILEGFDELPSTCRTESSVFSQLIHGQLLPLATVLLTSRPWATRVIHQKCSHRIFQHIEILGFTSNQIEEYVTSVFTDEGNAANDKAMEKIKEVMSYIKTYPQINACMYIPLTPAIVVSVYQKSKAGKCTLPKTLTGLYYTLLQTLLLRYLDGHPEHSQRQSEIESFKEDLPHEVYSKLLAISELAYSGICADQEGSVQLIYNLPSGLETLGLMQSVPQLYVTQGVGMSYNFLHLTVQEFLAALHISNMSPEQQLEHFQRHGEERRWRVVLRFLAGITKLVNLSPEDLRGLLLEKPNDDHSPAFRWCVYSVKSDVVLSRDHVNWMFETQRDDVVPSVLQEKTVDFICEGGLTLLDYYSLGYCIVHSHSQWVLTMQDNEIGEEEIRMLVAGASTIDDTSARVVGLRGSQRSEYDGGGRQPLSVSAEGLLTLFTELENVIHLQELHLELPAECSSITWPDLSGLRVLHLAISGERNWRLDTLLPHLSLESLTIESTLGRGTGTVVFEDCEAIRVLLSSSNCLKCLHFQRYESPLDIDPKGMEVITRAMSENEHLPLRCVVMECRCTFSDTAAHSLAVFIRKSTTLHHLSIERCTFSAHGLLELAQAIHHSSSLQERKLKDLTCTEDGDDEATYAQLLADYPHIVGSLLNREIDIESWDEEDKMDEETQKQLLDKALEKGYITTGLDVLLFIGAAGSGKTCYKHLCLGLPPPEVRNATGLSEHPVRTMSLIRGAVQQIPQNRETTDGTCQWIEVSEEEFKELIVEAVGEGEVKNRPGPDSEIMTSLNSKAAEESATHDLEHNVDSTQHVSSPQRENVIHSQSESSKVEQRTSENNIVTQSEKPSSGCIQYKSNFYQELRDKLRKIKSVTTSRTKNVQLMNVDWIYIVDSGGQPQFREMLPILVQIATACVLTLKLNEPLGDTNEVKFIEKDSELCRPYLSVLTNEQIVKYCSQIVDSQLKGCKLFVVGTHSDLEHECQTESRAKKNEELFKLLKPQLRNNLAVYKTGCDVELIYPVNSRKPEERDYKVVEQFRNAVHDINVKKKVDVPLCWFLLELLLQQLATKGDTKGVSKSAAKGDTNGDTNSGILSFEGCKQQAISQLKMSGEEFLTAVKFLAKNLGTILYFSHVLPNVIFTPQALMSILSEIVKIRHLLNDNQHLPDSFRTHREMWCEFQTFGLMDKTLLQTDSFKCFFSNIFKADDFLRLMRKLLIIAGISDTKFFFPSVLEELTPEEVQKKTVESRECLAPLVLYCPDTTVDCRPKENWLPVGSFTSLVAQLLNVHKWTLCVDEMQYPSCLYRNCIQFNLPENQPGIVTLVDRFRHMEVYLQVDPETIQTISKTVGSTIHNELGTVLEHLNCDRKDVQKAILCPKHNSSHIATLARSDKGQWRWTCKKQRSISGGLTDKQQPWLQDKSGGLSTDDLAEVENTLHEVAHNCIAFGLQLGVENHRIKVIEAQYANPCDRLREILRYRLRQLPLLTWQDIVKALRTYAVKENALASEIESRHIN